MKSHSHAGHSVPHVLYINLPQINITLSHLSQCRLSVACSGLHLNLLKNDCTRHTIDIEWEIEGEMNATKLVQSKEYKSSWSLFFFFNFLNNCFYYYFSSVSISSHWIIISYYLYYIFITFTQSVWINVFWKIDTLDMSRR